MIARVMGCTQELAERYPLIRTRNSIYTFLTKDAHFANSRGVRQQERRGWYVFGAMFSAKDGPRATSFNYSSAASYAPFEQLLGVKEHEMHHRAQLMLIERQLGIVPHLTRQFNERIAKMRAAQTA